MSRTPTPNSGPGNFGGTRPPVPAGPSPGPLPHPAPPDLGGGGGDADGGLGLRAMRFRAEAVGGDLRFETPEVGGARVVCEFPHPGDA